MILKQPSYITAVLVLTLLVTGCASPRKPYLETTIFDTEKTQYQPDTVDLSTEMRLKDIRSKEVINWSKNNVAQILPEWKKPIYQCGVKIPARKLNGMYYEESTQCVRIVDGDIVSNTTSLITRDE